MIKLHPEILRKDGKEQFVVLPYEEFVEIQEALDDAEDLLLLEEARRKDTGAPGVPLEEVMRQFGLKDGSSVVETGAEES
jgi:hypothetical protein